MPSYDDEDIFTGGLADRAYSLRNMPISESPEQAEKDRYDILTRLAGSVPGIPSDIFNLLSDLREAGVKVEQGDKWLPSFLAAQEEKPFEDRFATTEYFQKKMGGDPENPVSIAGDVLSMITQPEMVALKALPFIAGVSKAKKGIESLGGTNKAKPILNITKKGHTEISGNDGVNDIVLQYSQKHGIPGEFKDGTQEQFTRWIIYSKPISENRDFISQDTGKAVADMYRSTGVMYTNKAGKQLTKEFGSEASDVDIINWANKNLDQGGYKIPLPEKDDIVGEVVFSQNIDGPKSLLKIDIAEDKRKSGIGKSVVELIGSSNPNIRTGKEPLLIYDITKEGKPFWEAIGTKLTRESSSSQLDGTLSLSQDTSKPIAQIKRIAPDKDTWDALNITDEGMKKWRNTREGAKLLRNKELEDASFALIDETIPLDKRINNFQNLLKKVYPLEESKYTPEQLQELIDTLPSNKEIAMSVGAKSKNKKIIGVNDTIKSGDVIELRLDIPAYKNTNTWVVTAHKPASASARQADEVIGYGRTGYLKNVSFENMDLGRTFQVQAGDVSKFPMSTMKGEWIDHNPKELAKLAKKLMDDPEWTQVGFNPKKSLQFYERGTMNPVLDAEEVIQVGNFVLAKKTTLGKPMENIYEVGEKGLRMSDRATTPGQTIPAGTKIPYSGGGLVESIDIFGDN